MFAFFYLNFEYLNEHMIPASEIERLKEIYSLIFPHSRIGIIVESVPNFLLKEAVEISVENSSAILFAGNSKIAFFEVNENCSPIPEKYFLIQHCADPVKHYAERTQGAPKGLRWKMVLGVRHALMYRYPFLYEMVKSIYLKWFDRKKIKYTRLLNIRNPKNSINHRIPDRHENILMGMHWLDVGGAESFAVESAELAHAMGKEVFLVASHLSRPFYRERLEKICKIFEIDRQIARAYRLVFLNALVKKHQISMVHNHHNIHIYEALPLLRLDNESIQVVDSIHIDEKSRFLGGFPRLSIVWSNYIDYHHVISHRLKKLLASHGVHTGRILYGHLGKNIEKESKFKILDKDKKSIRLCFVGRMSGQKRPLLAFKLLLWAARYCKKNKIQVHVDVVGDGFYIDAFNQAVAISGMSSSFQVHPSHADVKSIMTQADVLLLSSENEGITLVAYEAYAAGTLVVSTDVGAQNELVPEALLLPASPWGAFRTWKQIFPKVATDANFVEQCVDSFHAKAAAIHASKRAEELFRTLYGD